MSAHSDAMRRRWQDPAFRARMVAAQRAWAAKPKVRAGLIERARVNSARIRTSAGAKAKMSAALRRRWANPADRAIMRAAGERGLDTIRRNRKPAKPDPSRGRNPWLSKRDRQMICAAVAAGERRIMVAVDWLITEARVGQIIRESRVG